MSGLNGCFISMTTLTDEAVQKAEKDRRRLAERTEKEEGDLSEDSLHDICTNTQDNIKDEKAELEHIIDQCDKDITKIGKQHYFSL